MKARRDAKQDSERQLQLTEEVRKPLVLHPKADTILVSSWNNHLNRYKRNRGLLFANVRAQIRQRRMYDIIIERNRVGMATTTMDLFAEIIKRKGLDKDMLLGYAVALKSLETPRRGPGERKEAMLGTNSWRTFYRIFETDMPQLIDNALLSVKTRKNSQDIAALVYEDLATAYEDAQAIRQNVNFTCNLLAAAGRAVQLPYDSSQGLLQGVRGLSVYIHSRYRNRSATIPGNYRNLSNYRNLKFTVLCLLLEGPKTKQELLESPQIRKTIRVGAWRITKGFSLLGGELRRSIKDLIDAGYAEVSHKKPTYYRPETEVYAITQKGSSLMFDTYVRQRLNEELRLGLLGRAPANGRKRVDKGMLRLMDGQRFILLKRIDRWIEDSLRTIRTVLKKDFGRERGQFTDADMAFLWDTYDPVMKESIAEKGKTLLGRIDSSDLRREYILAMGRISEEKRTFLKACLKAFQPEHRKGGKAASVPDQISS